jgi:hypothetical protein
MDILDRAFLLICNSCPPIPHTDAKDKLEVEYPILDENDILDSYLKAHALFDRAYSIGDRIRLKELTEDSALKELAEKHPGFSSKTYNRCIAHGLFISR